MHLPFLSSADPQLKHRVASEVRFVIERKQILGRAATLTKKEPGRRKQQQEQKRRLALEMYFKYGLKPRQIGPKLRLANNYVS